MVFAEGSIGEFAIVKSLNVETAAKELQMNKLKYKKSSSSKKNFINILENWGFYLPL